MMYEFGLMDAEKGWIQQLHLGALRNNNTRMFKTLGPDTGFDSIGDFEIAKPLAKFLDRLDSQNKLPKTVLYNLNPRDNELLATMLGNFQDGSVPGKMQFGSAWWFLDQKDGMEKHINTLSNLGLLSRFIGMLTDSRSFLSYPRHEYFRRILCNILGSDAEAGLIPKDLKLLGQMVEDICFNNAKNYFGMAVD
jgi:glucuronate isomerase